MTFRDVKAAVAQPLDAGTLAAGDGTVYGAALTQVGPFRNPMPYGKPKPNETVEWADGRKFIGVKIPTASASTYDLVEGQPVQLLGVEASASYPEALAVQDPSSGTGEQVRCGILLQPYTYSIDGVDRYRWVQMAGDCYALVDGNTDVVIGDSLKVVKAATYTGLVHLDAAATYTNENSAFAEALEGRTTNSTGLQKVRLRGVPTVYVAHT